MSTTFESEASHVDQASASPENLQSNSQIAREMGYRAAKVTVEVTPPGRTYNGITPEDLGLTLDPEQDKQAIEEAYKARQEQLEQAAEFLTAEAQELEQTAMTRPSVAANRIGDDVLSKLADRRVELGGKECVEIIDDRENLTIGGPATSAIEVVRTKHEDGSQELTITDNMIDLDHYRQVEVTAYPGEYGRVDVVLVDPSRRIPVEPEEQPGYIARIARHLREIAPRLTTKDDDVARNIALARLNPRP